jgi:hypothetical protein
MKTKELTLTTPKSEKTPYQIIVPLANWNPDSSTDAFDLNVTKGTEIIPVQRIATEFVFQRQDPLGKHIFSVKLKKNDAIIETINIILHIIQKVDILVTGLSTAMIVQEKIKASEIRLVYSPNPIVLGSSYFPNYHSTVEKPQELLYRDFKKLGDDQNVIQELCRMIGDRNEDIIDSWKAVVVLRFFRTTEGIHSIRVLLSRSCSEEAKTDQVHFACIKYLESLSLPLYRDQIFDGYKYIIDVSKSDLARIVAIRHLGQNSQRSDTIIKDFFVRLINEDSQDWVRIAAISQLPKFDLSCSKDNIIEWLTDSNISIRNQAINLATVALTDYTIEQVITLIEFEIDEKNIKSLIKWLLHLDAGRANDYACNVFSSGDPTHIRAVAAMLQQQVMVMEVEKLESIIANCTLETAQLKILQTLITNQKKK